MAVEELLRLSHVATTAGIEGCVRRKFGAAGSLRLVLPETLVPRLESVSGI